MRAIVLEAFNLTGRSEGSGAGDGRRYDSGLRGFRGEKGLGRVCGQRAGARERPESTSAEHDWSELGGGSDTSEVKREV